MNQKYVYQLIAAALLCMGTLSATAQNMGIGTNNPQSRLHVNGDLRLKNGVAITTISADSMFTNASDTTLPTQKAMQRYLQKGAWAPQGGALQSSMVFKDSSAANLNGPISVFIQGNYAYVISRLNSRLCIYDISNPGAIVPKDTIGQNLFNPFFVFVRGNYAYVVGNNDRLCIYDISNPDAIVAKDTIGQNLDGPLAVYVQGNYAYVASSTNRRLCIYDISNPDAIVAKGFTSQNLGNPSSVFVQGNYAYVVGTNDLLSIYDISNPDLIAAKGTITLPSFGDGNSVYVEGSYAYVASGNNSSNSRLSIYDISNPGAIVAKGSSSTSLNEPRSVYVQGNYAYVASSVNSQLCVFDISNPDVIQLAGSISGGALVNPVSVAVKNNYAFVASSNNNSFNAYELFNSTRSPVIGANGELAFEANPWISDDNGTYRTAGNVGIGTVTPQQTLDVNGSAAFSVTAITGNLTLNNTHHTILINTTASAVTVTLPAANSCARRVYVIVNRDDGGQTVSSYTNTAGVATTTIAAGSSITLQSDGTNWNQVR